MSIKIRPSRGRLIDFYYIKDPVIFDLTDDGNLNAYTQIKIEAKATFFLFNAHRLKHIIEHSTPLKFSPSPPPTALDPIMQTVIDNYNNEWDQAHNPFRKFLTLLWKPAIKQWNKL